MLTDPPNTTPRSKMTANVYRVLAVCIGLGITMMGTSGCMSYYYQYRLKSALKKPHFPNNPPNQIRLYQVTFEGAYDAAVKRLLNDSYQDRWGNYPVRYGAIEDLYSFEKHGHDLYRLATAGQSARIRKKALKTLYYLQSFDAEHRLKEGKQRRVIGGKQVDQLIKMAQSTNHDDSSLRAQALRILGAYGRPEALPILLESTKASPGRVRKGAWQGLISLAQIEPFNSRDEIRDALISLMKTGTDKQRITLLKSLPGLTRYKGIWLKSSQIMPLLDDPNPELVTQAIRLMAARDEPKALPRILKLAQSESPRFRRHATSFLIESSHLTADALEPLVTSKRLEDRVVALRICSRRKGKRIPPGTPNPKGFRKILERLCSDPNDKIATSAKLRLNHFINQMEAYRAACIVREELYNQTFDPPRKPKRGPKLSHAEIQELMKKRHAKQVACIKNAQALFPVPDKPTRLTPIYQTLVDQLAKMKHAGVIVVPNAKLKGGLKSDASKQPILSQEELITLRDDHGYNGPSFALTEVFLDEKGGEAWVQLAVNFAPLAGSGAGIILKKVNGKWTVAKQEPLWRS